MKSKIITTLIAAAMFGGVANAATIAVTVIANNTSTIGNITAGASATLLTGSAYVYVSSTELTASQFTSFSTTYTTVADAKTGFEALLASGTSTALRSPTFTSGIIASPGNLTLTPGDKSYVFFASGDYFGIYQGSNVPGSGAVTINPATNIEDLVGTSTVQLIPSTTTYSGFQLVQLAPVPEPSAALLGMLGALGLLRRRR